jgi:hypothetical protein
MPARTPWNAKLRGSGGAGWAVINVIFINVSERSHQVIENKYADFFHRDQSRQVIEKT